MARHTVTFNYTGALQTVVIPSTYRGGFQFDIRGAGGGYDTFQTRSSSSGGIGGRVTGVWSPTVGDTMNVYVAGVGGGFSFGTSPGAGGWGYHNGAAGGSQGSSTGGAQSGDPGPGGGGSSALLDGATFIAEAGGGGGGGGCSQFNLGGNGGMGGAVTTSGANGFGDSTGGMGGTGGGGATSSAAGAGGAGGAGGSNGTAGSTGSSGSGGTAGIGGTGGNGNAGGWSGGSGGGGGGGGTFGGGGGGGGGASVGGGGGGGGAGTSSATGLASAQFFDAGGAVGDGQVILSWQAGPTATPTAPTGTVTNTGTPTLTATYASADSASQQAYRILVYTQAAMSGAGGITNTYGPNPPNPAPTPLWDSGIVYSSGPGVSIPAGAPLPNGALAAYFAFQDAAGSDSIWSAWASTTWTQSAPTPQAPTVAVTPIVAQAQVQVTISAPDNLLTLDESDLENTAGSWVAVANCAVARSTAQFQHGVASLSMTSSAAGNMSARTGGKHPVQVGARYVGECSFRAATAGRSCQAQIQWYDSSGNPLSVSTGAAVTDTTTGWTQATVAANAPANAASADIFPLVQATAAGAEVHYVDEAGIFYATAGTPAWVQGGVYPTSYVVQRSLDGGTTWTTVHGGSAVAPNGGQVTFYDVGAPREQPIRYQVQSVSSNVSSSWSPAGPVTLSSDGQDWLMCAANHALDTPVTYQGPNLAALSHEDQAAYWPEGRPDAVVFHGTIHYEQFSSGMGSQLLTFAFQNDAQWKNFVAMRATQQPLLLKSIYGDTGREQWWIVLGADAGTTRYGGGDKAFSGNGQTNQIRTVQIAAYQVKEPT